MGASVKPDPITDRIQRTVSALKTQGASDADIDSYLTQHEGLKPVAPSLGHVAGASVAALQGALGGFGDEIGGAVDAGIDATSDLLHGRPTHFRQSYEDSRDAVRATDKAYAEEHPGWHAAAEIGGSVVPALLTGGAGEAAIGGRLGAGFGAKVASSALTGAGTAAVYGAGNATGSVGNRLRGAVQAVPAGAVLGASIPVAGKILGAAGQQVPKLARNMTGLGTNAEAVRQLGEIATQSGLSPDQIAANANAAKSAGSPVLLADALGDNGRSLVRWVGNQPSQAGTDLREVLENRNAGQYDRITSGVRDAMGRDYANMPHTDDALLAARRAAAEPAYAAAYAHPPVTTPTLQKALGDPDFQQAIAKGRALKAKADIARGVSAPNAASASATAPMATSPSSGDTGTLYAKLLHLNGGDASAAGKAMRVLGYAESEIPKGGAGPGDGVPIEVLDYAKRYLDNGIRRGFDAQSTFDHSTASATNGILSKVLDEVDAVVPEYAKARALYHSDSKMMEALALGRKGLTMHPDDLAASTADMSPGELDLARAGFMDAFKQKAGSVADRNDLSKQFLANPVMRQRFQTIAPSPDAMNSMNDLAGRETQMSRTLGAMTGNSTTAAQLQMNAAMNGGISPADVAVLPLSPHRSMVRLAGRAGQALRDRANTKLANQLGPMLQSEPGTPAFDQVIEALKSTGASSQGLSPAKSRLLQAISQAFAAQGGTSR